MALSEETLFWGFPGYGHFLECSTGRNTEEIRQKWNRLVRNRTKRRINEIDIKGREKGRLD